MSLFHTYDAEISAVPENFLEVADLEFYVPTDIQAGVTSNKTASGKLDAIGLLYSDEHVDEYPSYPSDNTDYYNVSVTNNPNHNEGPTWTLKMILPSGVRHAMNALNAGDIVRTTYGSDMEYRTLVRAYCKKFPGF